MLASSGSAMMARTMAGLGQTQRRGISIGTDMISSIISLQKARPWFVNESDGSNQAVDNSITLRDLFHGKTVALFGVPAPFTGTCTHEHYPGYKALSKDFLVSGCDQVVCYAVADPYAHNGWQTALGNDPQQITFLADPDATFARTYGVDKTYDDVSLGERSIRFSMIVEDGTVSVFRRVEDDAAQDAQELLQHLRELKESKEVA